MNKNPSPQQNNQPSQPGKKLQKQRQRILRELEEAQAAQAEALARFHRAETRLQKRTAELQRIAAQLLLVHQQLGEPAASIPLAVTMPTGERARVLEGPSIGGQVVESTGRTQESAAAARDELPAATQHTEEAPQASQVPLAEPGDEFPIAVQHRTDTLQASEAPQVEEEPSRQPLPHTSISNAQATEFAREARAVAEAAEQAAREAAERAVAAVARLEQVGSGARHLLQELQQMQTEVEQTNAIAQEAERAAREAEAAAEARFIAPTDVDGPTPEDESVGAQFIASTADLSAPGVHPFAPMGEEEPTPDTESVGARFIAPTADLSAPGVHPFAPQRGEGSPLELTVVEEEETIVEPSTATMVAEVAAAAAAEAEAVAEASSARTREARRFAQQADQVLADARAAIHNGLWSGEEADPYLQTLEREATHAHALLADAEAAEEQAQRTASNAEAEAEVAEGVAFTADDQVETSLDEKLENDESDVTLKIRISKKDED